MLIDFVFSTDVCTWMGWFAKDICIVVEDGIFFFFWVGHLFIVGICAKRNFFLTDST